MSEFNYASVPERRPPRGLTRRFQILTIGALALAVAAPLVRSSPRHSDSDLNARPGSRLSAGRYNCGYDPHGATDEWSNHRLNALRLSEQGQRADFVTVKTAGGIWVEDAEDIALVEDDGTVVASPSRFNLKNSSILFSPDGDGYRVAPADVGFSKDVGNRLGFFFGVDNNLGDGDNGYRDIALQGANFPFFGVSYDTIYVGTNGYITFNRGDTTSRLSPTSLATELPRIATLWADL